MWIEEPRYLQTCVPVSVLLPRITIKHFACHQRRFPLKTCESSKPFNPAKAHYSGSFAARQSPIALPGSNLL